MKIFAWTAGLLLSAAGFAQEVPLQPFSIDHRAADATAFNLSFLLDAPAGRHGFLQVRDGHIATPDGARVRLWGVNLSNFARGSIRVPPKEDAAFWAQTLARFGVNAVRLHGLDTEAPKGIIAADRDDTREFDSDLLDRLDYFIAELKKHGIYCNLNLNVLRTYKAGDGVRDWQLIGQGKAISYYDPRLIELQKEYARKILTHFNPYTRTEYRNEPAIAIIEIVNENSIVGAWNRGRLRGTKTSGPPQGWQDITPYYEHELTQLYNEWLAKKLSAAALATLRTEAGVGAGEPLPRLEPSQFAKASSERFETELGFYMDLERNFFLDMRTFLKQTLSSKSLLVGTSDFTYAYSSYPMLTSNSLLDIVDTHGPWELRPMVNEPLNSIPVRASRSAMAGKPLMVSEHNHRFPNDYLCEGIPLLAAYASFQDWDAIFLYSFELKPRGFTPFIASRADLSHDPVKLANLAAGAMMFLRGDVHAARQTVERSYTSEQVKESLRAPGSLGVYFTPDFTPGVALRHGSRIASLDGKPTQKLSYPEAGTIVSDTNELTWHVTPQSGPVTVEADQQFSTLNGTGRNAGKDGMVTVDTPKTQALIGFLPANRQEATNVSAEIRDPFASIVVTALDGKPIAQSARLLVAATARENNTKDGPPTRIEPVAGKLILRNLQNASAVEYTPLDGSTRPVGKPHAAQRDGAHWQIDLDAVTTWYLISVRR